MSKMNEVTAAKGGLLILLDVPPGSAITLDGITRITPSPDQASAASSSSPLMSFGASAPFHRGLWIINNIPSCSCSSANNNNNNNDSGDFHLLVVRSGMHHNSKSNSNGSNGRGDCRTLPVGFVLTSSSSSSSSPASSRTASEFGYEWIFARKYDPYTEEISNNEVDELTMKNIVLAIQEGGGELGKFVISYDQFMGSNASANSNDAAMDDSDSNNLPSWDRRTSTITASYLQRRHGLSQGDKIVPSSDDPDDPDKSHTATSSMSATDSTTKTKKVENNKDGTSISYPPIPCIDPSITARQLTQHHGTRKYLSTLQSEKRTSLLFGRGVVGPNTDNSTDITGVGEYVWKDVLSQYYGRSKEEGGGRGNTNKTQQQSEGDFLADLELSFLLFLFVQCHTSLEHWRDAISMCALSTITMDELSTTTSSSTSTSTLSAALLHNHPQFFRQLLSILCHQLSCIETDFFQEVEYSSGENNFMVCALRRLCNACESSSVNSKRKRGDGDREMECLKSMSQDIRQLVRDRFGLDLSSAADVKVDDDDDDDDEDIMEVEEIAPVIYEDDDDNNNNNRTGLDHQEVINNLEYDDANDDTEEDEEDGPVIIPYNEVEASMARSSSQPTQASKMWKESNQQQHYHHNKEYPLLYAAMTVDEDEVMACARILDEAKDVSLVREAAAYLEEVEANRGNMF